MLDDNPVASKAVSTPAAGSNNKTELRKFKNLLHKGNKTLKGFLSRDTNSVRKYSWHDDGYGSDGETAAPSITSTSASSVQRMVDEELEDLKILESNNVPEDEISIRYNFQELVNGILLAQSSSKWRKTSTLMTSKKKIHDAINDDYTEILLDQSRFGRDGVEVHLLAADHVVNEFVGIYRLLAEHTTMPLSLQEMILSIVEEYIRPRISDYYTIRTGQGLEFSPGDTAKVITWIDRYLKTLSSHCLDVRADKCWETDRDSLVTVYIDFVRQEMKTLLMRAHSLEVNIRIDKDGHAVSSMPEDIIFLLDSQLAVARNYLPHQYTEIVLHTCNEELRNMVCDLMLKIGTEWRNLNSKWYCALINDCSRLIELCEERNETVLVLTHYKEFGDSVLREFAELSLHAASYLCERIMSTLSDPNPILTSIGDESWEKDDTQSSIERTTATLSDYFEDLDQWLGRGYYFPKVLKSCFDKTLKTYVESFLANTLSRGVNDPVRVAEELNLDYMRLSLFFSGTNFEKYHGVAGYYTQAALNEKLHIIRCLSKLVNPAVSAEQAASEVRLTMKNFQETFDNGSVVVFHVVGLRKKHSGRESVEWLRVVSNAKKAASLVSEDPADQKDVSSSQFYNIVDLRNSRYLHNIRPLRREMHKRISAQSLKVSETTARMLTAYETPVHQKIVRAFKVGHF